MLYDMIKINEELNLLFCKYQTEKSMSILCSIFSLLQPVTDNVIRNTLFKLHLPTYGNKEDMQQDAFIKLHSLIGWYQPERSKQFIAFWKISLSRHLLSQYHSKRHNVHTPVEIETYDKPKVEDQEISKILRISIEEEIQKWKKDKDKLLALAIIKHRFFTENEMSQLELASTFKRSQGFISLWEKWLKEKIRDNAKTLFANDITE